LRIPKAREETDEERLERKRRQAIKGADDLEGWLVLEDGSRVRRGDHVSATTQKPASDDEFDFEPRGAFSLCPMPFLKLTSRRARAVRGAKDFSKDYRASLSSL
jgi:hypothetical protein